MSKIAWTAVEGGEQVAYVGGVYMSRSIGHVVAVGRGLDRRYYAHVVKDRVTSDRVSPVGFGTRREARAFVEARATVTDVAR